METPSLESGLPSGITRAFVITLLRENGVEVRETSVLQEELARFDEAFLTSTIRGLAPIRRIDEKEFATLRPTAFFHKIQGIFQSWVDQEIGKKLKIQLKWPIIIENLGKTAAFFTKLTLF